MGRYKLCAVVPVYNHGDTIGTVVMQLRQTGLPCVLVDDGSEPGCAAVLQALADESGVSLVKRDRNGGKGAAVRDGLLAAQTLGYTHALQVDADGQHALDDVSKFADASRAQPDAAICGAPLYGDDVPRSRLYGRWLTRVWVWINTLSCDIPDAMCGFRVYPLARVSPLLVGPSLGQRMDFDIAILVRLHWMCVPMVWLPTRVIYPENGVSHFKGLRDNIYISRMHARLFFGMLLRAPRLIAQHCLGKSKS